MVYYNDNEPFVAQWLRNLIAAGHLPAGEVDERAIQEVQPDDLQGYTQCHFFAGIGGWPYALELAEWGDRPVWTGSCPCQPFSAAGKRQASNDARHLWPAWFRLIRECRPERIFGEQVAGAAGLGWLDVVSTDLEAEAYTVGAVVLGAHSVGAPHIRQRLYFVADSDDQRLQGRFSPKLCERARERAVGASGSLADSKGERCREAGKHSERSPQRITSSRSALAHATGAGGRRIDESAEGGNGRRQRPVGGSGSPEIRHASEPRIEQLGGLQQPQARDTGWGVSGWESEPDVGRVAHGVPARVGRLRAYGNAIVPQVAAAFVRAYMEVA